FGKARMAFNRVDLARKLREHGRGVTRARADFEDAVVGVQLECFGHQSDDVGLRNRLLLVDRERGIVVCELREPRGHESLSRHPADGAGETVVPDAPASELLADHVLALTSHVDTHDTLLAARANEVSEPSFVQAMCQRGWNVRPYSALRSIATPTAPAATDAMKIAIFAAAKSLSEGNA